LGWPKSYAIAVDQGHVAGGRLLVQDIEDVDEELQLANRQLLTYFARASSVQYDGPVPAPMLFGTHVS